MNPAIRELIILLARRVYAERKRRLVEGGTRPGVVSAPKDRPVHSPTRPQREAPGG